MDFQWHQEQPGAMSLSLIMRHCWEGIIQAILMDYFYPTHLLLAILAFAPCRPDHSYTIVCLEVARWFLDPHEYRRWVTDPFRLDRSVVVFGSYVVSLILLRGVPIFWRYMIVAPLAAAWNHTLITAGAITVLYTFMNHVGFTNALVSAINFLRWLHGTTYHLERYKWIVVDRVKDSIVWRFSVKIPESMLTWTFWFLGRKTYSELKPFIHPKMNPRTQIRLLSIRRNIPFLPIKARLEVVDIADPPRYEAISYTWDPNPTETFPVAINGMQHSVPSNVHDILSRMGTFMSPRYIWIDSICINQTDDTEKEHQIKLMRQVYSRAIRVLACLGESRKASHAAGLLSMLVMMKMKIGATETARYILAMWYDRRSNHVLETHLTGFIELLDHRWFERAWVIQEVVFARQLTIHHRNYVWIWEFFLQATEILINPDVPQIASIFQSTMGYGQSRNLPYGLSHGIMLARTREVYQHGRQEPFYVILQRFMAFRATKRHDKIFALLGFIDANLDHLIDYQKPIEELIVEISKYLLKNGQLVHVLHLAGTGFVEGQPPSASSWVVDWSMSRVPRTLAHSDHDPHLWYRAAVSQNASMRISQDVPWQLHAAGRIVDNIRHLGAASRAPRVEDGTFQVMEQTRLNLQWLEEARAIAEAFANLDRLGNSPTIEDAFLRTLFGDRTQTSRPMPDRLIPTVKTLMRAFERIHNARMQQGLVLDGDGQRLEAHLVEHPELYEDFIREMGANNYWELTSSTMLIGDPEYHRRFCVTVEGRISLVPPNTLVGDVIAVVHGAQVPFVIRPKTGAGNVGYELVGECYVHGLMDGEALKLKLPGRELVFV